MSRLVVPGAGFQHAIYLKAVPDDPSRALHVYIDGDGTPYIRPSLPAADPTSRDPTVLRLIALDSAPALLLGRPCYHGLAASEGCTQAIWTDARYSEQVVASMATALRQVAPEDRPLVLIGFSGGGTLAVLLAQRLPQVVAVVTLAGNLAIDRWTEWHGYGRLEGSLNPAANPRLPEHLVQLHYAGSDDRTVPPWLVRDTVHLLGGELVVLENTTHARGWEQHWPAILEVLARRQVTAPGDGRRRQRDAGSVRTPD